MRTGRLLLVSLLALAALAGVWGIWPQGVPLHDHTAVRDEPYRYVSAPSASTQTPPPTSATLVWRVGSLNAALQRPVGSDERPRSQVLLEFRPGDLLIPEGVDTVTVTAAPVAPDVHPEGRRIDGNVYRVSAQAQPPADVTVRADPPAGAKPNRIVLRTAWELAPSAAMFHRPSPQAPWRQLETELVGKHLALADLSALGEYALAFPEDAVPADPPPAGSSLAGTGSDTDGSGVGTAVPVLAVLVLCLGLMGTVVAIRRGRVRADGSRAPGEDFSPRLSR